MAAKSAPVATKAKATEVESSTTGCAATFDDETAKFKVTFATGCQKIMSQIDSIKACAHCDPKVQTASTLKTVQDSQPAASITSALISQSTDSIQQRLDSLQATVEQGERKHKPTSMVVRGFSPKITITRRQTPASVHQLIAQHATNQQFSITSVTCFGNPTDGPKPIRVVFSSTDDKHALYTASKGLRSDKIYLDDDLTPLQLQERQQLSHIHRVLRQRQLHPFCRGSVLFCKEEDGDLKNYKPEEVASTPLATQQPHPCYMNSKSRRPAVAAIAPRHGLTQPAAPQIAAAPSTAATTEPALSATTSARLP